MSDSKNNDCVFPFRFSPVISVISAAALVLCAGGFAYESYRFADFLQGDISSVYSWTQHILFFLACIALFVLTLSILIRSRYILTDRELIIQNGFIRQKFELAKIVSVHHFRGAGKLAVYFDGTGNDYLVVSVSADRFNDFVRELTARNEKIEFSFSTAEEEEEFKKKK